MLLEPGVKRGRYHDRKPESREFQSLFAGSGTKPQVLLDDLGRAWGATSGLNRAADLPYRRTV